MDKEGENVKNEKERKGGEKMMKISGERS